MRTFLPIALFALLTASTAYPWGPQGHAAIGLVAEQRLTPEARRNVERILGNADLASIASWMDQLRGAANGFGPLASNTEARELTRRFPHNDEWHYVNLPLGETTYTDDDPFARPDDVVHEINLAVQVLEGKSSIVSPRIAIYMIVHFVGDLHQPLHVGTGYYDLSDPAHPVLVTDPKAAAGKESDKGGNDLSYGSQRSEELHAYWDSGLPEKLAGSREPAALEEKLTGAIQAGAWASAGDHHSWAEAWATESLRAARQAYAGLSFGPAELKAGALQRIPIVLPANYDATALPLARERLAKAGFHLAELLNAIAWPAGALTAAPIQHDFLAVDEGLSNLLHVNEANPKLNWLVHLGKEQPRDLQLEGGDRLLVSHDHGYCEYDIATGRQLKDVSLFHDVSSVRRLANGDLLIAGVDFDRPKKSRGDGPLGDPTGRHVIFAEYDAAGQVVRRTAYVGDFLRLVRETAAGTYLCGCNQMLREADGAGNWVREFPEVGFQHAWMALRLPNGDILMSAGTATPVPPRRTAPSFMVEVDSSGKTVRRLGAADQVPARVRPNFYAMFQVLPNGDVVAANWQSHGPGHNNSGVQILEFDPQGAIVWEWSDRAFVSSIQGVLVLDGLDRSVLNDERNGVMGPAPGSDAPAHAH